MSIWRWQPAMCRMSRRKRTESLKTAGSIWLGEGVVRGRNRSVGNGARSQQCFWDTVATGQPTSDGGTGKTTAEMQTASTFLEAGWDFVGETADGPNDVWRIAEGLDYPRLWWEAQD